jgi:hypothetical protein
MARLGHWGAESGHEHAENLTLAGTTMTFDTGTKRTGTRSFKFDTSATTTLSFAFTGSTNRTYYACDHVYFPSATGFPTANPSRLLAFMTGVANNLCGIGFTTTGGGAFMLYGPAFGVIGSDSALISLDTWYRLELVVNVNSGAGADDTVTGYVDGVQIGHSTTETLGTTAPGMLRFGFISDPGTSEVVYHDDIALNDSTGSVNNGLVGDQKIYALFPASDNARGNWTAGGAGTTDLWEAVNNTPPVGILPAAGVGATVQIQNSVAAANANGDFNLTDYTTAGIGANDIITAVQTIVEQGNSSTTGSDAISHEMVSNPAIATTGEVSADIVSGTYPASWNRGVGTMTEYPSVTLGTQPVMRVTKVDSSTRFNAVCLMVLMVAVSPAAAASPNLTYRPLRSMTRLRR